MLPSVPLIFIVCVPVGVVAAVEIDKVEVAPEAEGVTGFVLKEQDAPEGSPEQDKVTDDAVPLVRVAVTVVAVLPPCTTEPPEGLAESAKSKEGVATLKYPVEDVVDCGFVSVAIA